MAAAVALGVSGISVRTVHPNRESTELGKASSAFAKHKEELFAHVGVAESPASWAQENYELNGGDKITCAGTAQVYNEFMDFVAGAA